MTRRFLAVVTVVMALLTVLTPAQAAVQTPQKQTAAVFPAEVIGEDFPDPDVFERNGTWYAYSTNNGRGHVPESARACG